MNVNLTEAEQDVIQRTAKTGGYLSSPVPLEILEQFSNDLLGFTFIPPQKLECLSKLYGTDSNCMRFIKADWAEAFACGALRMFDEKTISFPTRIQLADGSAIEVSIMQNRNPGKFPWYLSYVPQVERMKLMRDTVKSENEDTVSSFDPLPPILVDDFKTMKQTEDYRSNPVPDELDEELKDFDRQFSSQVWVPQRWTEKILELAQSTIDVPALLERDWAAAREVGAVRFYEGKIMFPVSIPRKPGELPIEIALKRENKPDKPDVKPWLVNYVDTYIQVKPKAIAGQELYQWAHLGNFNEVLENLADIALDEKWGFDDEDSRDPYSILRSYLTYTFFRLKMEGKVLESREQGIAAFNTGLVDKTYEPIYACFSPATSGKPWRFEAFCKAGSRQWGKKLASSFNPLPKRASYFQRKEDLLFDTDRPLERDADHILLDNINRLPHDFLEEELRTSDEAIEALEAAFSVQDNGVRHVAFERLTDIIDDDFKIQRRLIHRLDDAIELAQKRVEWNFKTAVPAFYPTKNQMSLLLPLDLTEDENPDVALVVELMESGVYIGQTILTMRMAYNNARLICRPDSDWLNTSLRPSSAEVAAQ